MKQSSQHTKMNLCPNREIEKFEQLGEFSTKIENIFNPLVVAKIGSNYGEKNLEVENLVGLSL